MNKFNRTPWNIAHIARWMGLIMRSVNSKQSFAPQMAESHGIWHRFTIQRRIWQEIKRRIRAEFSPYILR